MTVSNWLVVFSSYIKGLCLKDINANQIQHVVTLCNFSHHNACLMLKLWTDCQMVCNTKREKYLPINTLNVAQLPEEYGTFTFGLYDSYTNMPLLHLSDVFIKSDLQCNHCTQKKNKKNKNYMLDYRLHVTGLCCI